MLILFTSHILDIGIENILFMSQASYIFSLSQLVFTVNWWVLFDKTIFFLTKCKKYTKKKIWIHHACNLFLFIDFPQNTNKFSL